MLDDPGLLAEAQRIYGAGDEYACVRARRFLDQAAGTGGEHPSAQLIYGQAADYLDVAGGHVPPMASAARARLRDSTLRRMLARPGGPAAWTIPRQVMGPGLMMQLPATSRVPLSERQPAVGRIMLMLSSVPDIRQRVILTKQPAIPDHLVMAQTTTITITDDIDGSEGAETVTFSFEGQAYEIDLSSKNLGNFRKGLQPFIDSGRKVKRQAAGRPASSRATRSNSSTIRAWAAGQGLDVSERGRIPAAIVAKYEADH
jgi:hypothetical protein